MADVVDASGGQVIQDEYFITAVQQNIRQVRANETRTTCYQDPHRCWSSPPRPPVATIIREFPQPREAAKSLICYCDTWMSRQEFRNTSVQSEETGMLEGPLVFLDIDTQRDFMNEDGALYVPRSTEIVPNLEKLTQFAIRQRIPVLATACSHHSDDPELSRFPPHCMAGTQGKQRIGATARPDSVILPVGTRLQGELPPHLTLEKNEYDLFSRSDSGELIARYNEHNPLFVVYGVATDYCVRKAVDGLLLRNCRTAILVDAVRAIDASAESGILTDFARQGALLAVTRVVCAASPA
jgi:nicotinamidase/pyrazinamidase